MISEPVFVGRIFGLILLLSDGSLRLDIFGLKRNWNKRNSFLQLTICYGTIGGVYLSAFRVSRGLLGGIE